MLSQLRTVVRLSFSPSAPFSREESDFRAQKLTRNTIPHLNKIQSRHVSSRFAPPESPDWVLSLYSPREVSLLAYCRRYACVAGSTAPIFHPAAHQFHVLMYLELPHAHLSLPLFVQGADPEDAAFLLKHAYAMEKTKQYY